MNRRNRIVPCLLFVIIVIASSSQAVSQESLPLLPTNLVSGLELFKTAGPEAAIRAWVKGSPYEGDKDVSSEASLFLKLQSYVGQYKSYDVVQIHELARTTKIVYLVMNFENGPVFGRFLVFKKADGTWIIPAFNFESQIEKVFPPGLMYDVK